MHQYHDNNQNDRVRNQGLNPTILFITNPPARLQLFIIKQNITDGKPTCLAERVKSSGVYRDPHGSGIIVSDPDPAKYEENK